MTLPIWNKLLPNERASPQRLYERVRKEIALIVVPPTPESKIASVAVVVAVGEGIGEFCGCTNISRCLSYWNSTNWKPGPTCG